MLTQKWFLMASPLIVVSLLLAGCAPAAETPAPKPLVPSPTPKPAAEQPRYGGVLPLPAPSDPPDLDIHGAATIALFAPLGGVYNGLLQYDQSDKIVADLAERWEVRPDGKVYTFHLRKGVKWHDGKPFTSADAKFSLERMDKYTGLKFVTEVVNKIEAPDENTLQITLKEPQAGFSANLAHGRAFIGPKHVIDAKGNLKRDALGTGPFKLKDYVAGISIDVVKNDAYFIKGLPYLDRITYYIIKDTATRMAAFRAGRVKIYGHPPTQGELGPSHVEAIKKSMPQAVVRPYASMEAFGLMPNPTKPPWSDVRVRRAAFLAVDREKARDVVTEGTGEIGVSVFAGEWALPKEEMMKMPGYAKPDIEGAKKLMAEAGFPNGFKTDSLVQATPTHQAIGVLFKDAVAVIGIAVDLNVAETTVYNDQRFRKAFATLAGAAGSGHTDPDIILGDFYVTGSPTNYAGYSNPYFDELYAKQSRTVDTEERRKIVWEMQRVLLRDVPIAIAYWSNVPYAWWREVRGFTPPVSHQNAYGYQDIWLAK